MFQLSGIAIAIAFNVLSISELTSVENVSCKLCKQNRPFWFTDFDGRDLLLFYEYYHFRYIVEAYESFFKQ
jgi:hypothetical protein